MKIIYILLSISLNILLLNLPVNNNSQNMNEPESSLFKDTLNLNNYEFRKRDLKNLGKFPKKDFKRLYFQVIERKDSIKMQLSSIYHLPKSEDSKYYEFTSALWEFCRSKTKKKRDERIYFVNPSQIYDLPNSNEKIIVLEGTTFESRAVLFAVFAEDKDCFYLKKVIKYSTDTGIGCGLTLGVIDQLKEQKYFILLQDHCIDEGGYNDIFIFLCIVNIKTGDFKILSKRSYAFDQPYNDNWNIDEIILDSYLEKNNRLIYKVDNRYRVEGEDTIRIKNLINESIIFDDN